ncbi:MAG: hypothetical protein ACXVA9_10625 [Bdellovibrionales bacterium]
MNLESTLYYFTHHSESIIQWLFLSILLLSAFVIGRLIFAKKEAAAGGAEGAVFADGSDVKVFLQKILDQTAKLETVKLEGISPANMGEVEAQVQTLKKDLQAREEEITKIKSAGGSAVAGDADKLGARIKELETKLAEYEILEDDIADLSLYKEENIRLRSELDKLKSGATTGAAAPSCEDIVAEFAEAVGQEASSAPVEMQVPDTGNPMADFESAVNLEKKIQGVETPAAPAVAAVAPPPSAPAAVATAPLAAAPPAVATPEAEGDDLFAEFAAPSAEADDGGGLDTDKMMQEMAALVSMEPAKGTALHEEIDTEKMAMEATRLTKS